MSSGYPFPSHERLKSQKIIGRLFNREGQTFARYPLRLIWLATSLPHPTASVQVAVSVPKRQFKRAVHRNRIKRLLREAYRLERPALLEAMPQGQPYALMLLYTGKHEPTFAEVQAALRPCLRHFAQKVQHASSLSLPPAASPTGPFGDSGEQS